MPFAGALFQFAFLALLLWFLERRIRRRWLVRIPRVLVYPVFEFIDLLEQQVDLRWRSLT